MGAIDVWKADLSVIEDGLEDLLCVKERARAARILSERDRTLWARSRGLLRALLGRYLDRDARELCFVLGPHGKPALAHDWTGAATDLRFNLSHSGALALIAVTDGHEVGVDIERGRERYTAEFLHAWVAREAAGKCLGVGLATPAQNPPRKNLWTTQLDVGPRAAAAVAYAGGDCELRRLEWRG
jgi:phosphopantetheinyl transferase